MDLRIAGIEVEASSNLAGDVVTKAEVALLTPQVAANTVMATASVADIILHAATIGTLVATTTIFATKISKLEDAVEGIDESEVPLT